MKLEWKTEKRKVDDLIPYEANPRTITETQKIKLKKSLEKFGLVELPAINTDNKIIAGHQRLAVLKLLGKGQETIEVRVPNRKLTGDEFKQYLLTSNRVSGEWDWKALNDFDKDILLKIGFDIKDIKKILGAVDAKVDARIKLTDRFIVSPFSVLDTKTGLWQDRKRAWLALTGDLSETKENVGVAIDPQYYQNKTKYEKFLGRELTNEEFQEVYTQEILNGGSSIFDPVLAEVIYTWFCPRGGKILDPFAGEQTKAVVAGELKKGYTGIDIREEQVILNNKATEEYENVKCYTGDSNDLDKLVPDSDYDLIFTSPPYYDLEVYSKEDMSALGTYEEFLVHYKNIFKQCVDKLKDNRFLIVKLGEIRNKKTGVYRNFISDNIRIFNELGLKYYNEIILLNATGTLPIRAPRAFNKSRKIGKGHQNVLAFYKGNAKDLFKKERAIYATHQSILAFFKGDPANIEKDLGEVAREIDFKNL